jgi:pimeloyl-ACP methyl ester carboxylesterase
MPGYGESDPPAQRPSIADYAAALGDFVDAMRFREIDLLGHQSGALVAAELGILRPEQIRRVVMVSVPLFTAEEREAAQARSQQAALTEDGAGLLREWQRQVQGRGPGTTLEECAESFAERLHAGATAAWGSHAASHYAASERLPLLRQPVLVIRPKDELWDASARARQLLRGARVVELPEQGAGLFSVAPQLVAQHAREFLSG